jgi:hypothetical protein
MAGIMRMSLVGVGGALLLWIAMFWVCAAIAGRVFTPQEAVQFGFGTAGAVVIGVVMVVAGMDTPSKVGEG